MSNCVCVKEHRCNGNLMEYPIEKRGDNPSYYLAVSGAFQNTRIHINHCPWCGAELKE